MAALFDRDGIQFLYPENWELQSEETETGWSVSLQSADTAFVVIAFDEELPDPDYMARTALEALKAEYEDLESEDCLESVAGQPAVGHDVRFFSLDLTNTCWIRSFYSSRGTVLAMWQVNDLELDRNEPVLRAITASLKVEED
jgi:hypothetical protein